MVRFLYEMFFELAICAMINVSNNEAGGTFQWLISLIVIVALTLTLVATLSLFCKNGPYIHDTFQQSSLLASFWGRRKLHEDLIKAAVLAQEEKTGSLSTVKSIVASAPVTNASQTQTMFNSNVPLNQQIGAAVDLESPTLFEGGEQTLTTERGLTTERAMITVNFNNQEKEQDERSMALMEIKRDANLIVQLEDHVELNQRYKTVFSGLKLNTAHNSAIVEPVIFMLRRLIYAALIVFMPHMPHIATLVLLGVCFATLAFTIVEKPWSAPEINKLAITNEALLYLLIVLIMASPCLVTETERQVFSWVIIAVVTLTIHVNLTVMVV